MTASKTGHFNSTNNNLKPKPNGKKKIRTKQKPNAADVYSYICTFSIYIYVCCHYNKNQKKPKLKRNNGRNNTPNDTAIRFYLNIQILYT